MYTSLCSVSVSVTVSASQLCSRSRNTHSVYDVSPVGVSLCHAPIKTWILYQQYITDLSLCHCLISNGNCAVALLSDILNLYLSCCPLGQNVGAPTPRDPDDDSPVQPVQVPGCAPVFVLFLVQASFQCPRTYQGRLTTEKQPRLPDTEHLGPQVERFLVTERLRFGFGEAIKTKQNVKLAFLIAEMTTST